MAFKIYTRSHKWQQNTVYWFVNYSEHSGHYRVHTICFNINELSNHAFAHMEYLHVSCGSDNKQQLFQQY
jgi:hypothetical protein